jgi:anti-sigma regulatory factor (Ser/Thr protein kinase)
VASTDAWEIRLEMPADLRYLHLARLVATGMANQLDLDFEECDDLRIGVDELCVALLAGIDAPGPLRLLFRAVDDRIEVTGALDGAPGTSPELDPLTTQIVRTVVDRYELTTNDGGRQFTLEKHLVREH